MTGDKLALGAFTALALAGLTKRRGGRNHPGDIQGVSVNNRERPAPTWEKART